MIENNGLIRRIFGEAGFTEATGAVSRASGYYALYCDGDASFSATSVDGDDLSERTRYDGTAIFGNFTAVTVTSGTVLCYHKSDNASA